VFTYFVYQQLVRGFNSVQLENAKANKPNIQAPGKATAPAEPPARPSDVKVIGKDSDKQPIPQK
jgi:hypothetical protein